MTAVHFEESDSFQFDLVFPNDDGTNSLMLCDFEETT